MNLMGYFLSIAQKRLVTVLSTIDWTFMPELIIAITSYANSIKQLHVLPLAFGQTYFRVIKKILQAVCNGNETFTGLIIVLVIV